VIGSAAVTYLGYKLAIKLSSVLILLVVALFFAVVLAPAVDVVQRRGHVRRGVATLLVFLVGLGLLVAMLYSFIRPLAEQATQFANDLPAQVEKARDGEGPVGDLVRRYDLEDYVQKNQDRLRESLTSLGAPALDIARSVFNGLFAAVTVMVLTILMLLQGPVLASAGLKLVPEERRAQVQRVAGDSARAVAGYVFGNLLISAIAGTATWIVLAILGVPYAGVIGLFVAFADLIPLVGATLGAIPTVALALLHSQTAGIVMLIFYIVYQQFENHVLQVTIMARTVRVNPLTVLISVLVGVELLGFLGALLAIPAAGVIQVVVRDVYDERRGRFKPEFTVGNDETPVSEADEPAAVAAPAKKTPAKKTPAKKATAKRAPAKRAPAKKAAARRS
jgi:predicted PurR-regulated permease PerM